MIAILPENGVTLLQTFLRWIPKNLCSSLCGIAAAVPLPRVLRRRAYAAFAECYGVVMEEVRDELEEYPSFDAFFTRELPEGSRPIADGLVCPVDGMLQSLEQVSDGTVLQAKGITYSLSELLCDAALARSFHGGFAATWYLAPGDYHRVHSPVTGTVVESTRIPGTLWPVRPETVSAVPNIYAVNERVVSVLRDDVGRTFVTVAVGAFNVGSIEMVYDARRTNTGVWNPFSLRSVEHVALHPAVAIERGGHLATFHLGSTVIVLWPEGIPPSDRVQKGEKMKMGQQVAEIP